MHLIVLRHGIAIDRLDAACPGDAERWLTGRGVRRTTAACHGLAALDVAPDLILTSPLIRARQTADIAAEVLACGDLRETESLAGGVRTAAFFEELGGLPDDTVLCVGHAPQLDLLVARALPADASPVERFKKAGAVLVAFDGRAAPATGHLIWQMQPSALRALGRGD